MVVRGFETDERIEAAAAYVTLRGESVIGPCCGSDTADIVDAIADMELDFLFVIGGGGLMYLYNKLTHRLTRGF